MSELLPCPFCGHHPELRKTGQASWCVMCVNLDCVAMPAANSPINGKRFNEAEATAAWNSRAPITSSQAA